MIKTIDNIELLDTNRVIFLKNLKERLLTAFNENLLKVVLFGFRAIGGAESDSDTEVAIIFKRLGRELRRKALDIITSLELEDHSPLSIILFSEEDFNMLLKIEQRLAQYTISEGIGV